MKRLTLCIVVLAVCGCGLMRSVFVGPPPAPTPDVSAETTTEVDTAGGDAIVTTETDAGAGTVDAGGDIETATTHQYEVSDGLRAVITDTVAAAIAVVTSMGTLIVRMGACLIIGLLLILLFTDAPTNGMWKMIGIAAGLGLLVIGALSAFV